jgi:hypothetical protein
MAAPTLPEPTSSITDAAGSGTAAPPRRTNNMPTKPNPIKTSTTVLGSGTAAVTSGAGANDNMELQL